MPADLLILSSSGQDGLCYCETRNLDGESNLKIKSAVKPLNFLAPSDLCRLKNSDLLYELPNKDLYKFDGNMTLSQGSPIPISNENILLRGMSLRNTESIYGLVVYTGRETKIQLNGADQTYKTSGLMRETGRYILWIFGLQCGLAAVGAFVGAGWEVRNLQNPYLGFNVAN